MPALTVLIYFDLKRMITGAMRFDDDDSCLTCAIRYRRNTLVFFLVEHGADWHDDWDHTIRAQCSSYKLEGNETMLKILAAKGARIDLGVDNGDLLFKAIDKEEDEPKGILLELGAKFDPENITYYTPLMCAVLGGDEMDVCELLMGGVDVNEKNQHGRDALIYAALVRHESVVEPLLEAGADVHSRDENGMTALCAACEGGDKKIVKLLLAKGAEISAQDRSGQTPESIAAEHGHAQILRLLSCHGTDGDSEDEVEAEKEAVPDRDQIDRLIDLFRRNPGVGSPGSKIVQAVQEEVIKRGYDKAVGAVLDGHFRERPYDNDSVRVGQSQSGPSKSSNPALPRGFTLQETQRGLAGRSNKPST